jgi:hypothetical protein
MGNVKDEKSKNVYILGAGFSKGLGLPLQDEFLLSAREVYFKDTAKFAHFKKIFDYGNELAKVRKYLSLPLSNLESLFNLLEMHAFYSNDNRYLELKKDYVNLIKDVLVSMTPMPIGHLRVGGKLVPSAFPMTSGPYSDYVKFLTLFFNHTHDGNIFLPFRDTIISLNYDLAVEGAVALLNYAYTTTGRGKLKNHVTLNMLFSKKNIEVDSPANHFGGRDVNILFEPMDKIISDDSPVKFIKLHGSINWKIDGETFIIPPTWNKSDRRIRILWEEAYKELSSAERIIFIGYSFPETDSYIKSLIALAMNNNERLQGIYFINPDNGTTRDRSLCMLDEHFKKYCAYREWTFSELMNDQTAGKFIAEKLHRSIKTL